MNYWIDFLITKKFYELFVGFVVNLLKDKTNKRYKSFEPLTAKKINSSEILICRLVQRVCFGNEINQMKNGQHIPSSSTRASPTPEIDNEGILRLSRRIDYAECVGPMVKRPIILPKDHKLTLLIAQYHHEQCKHQNVDTMICNIGQQFWIPCVRRIAKSIESHCQLCRNLKAAPKPPLVGSLPIVRVSPFVRPFTFTGIDYFGH